MIATLCVVTLLLAGPTSPGDKLGWQIQLSDLSERLALQLQVTRVYQSLDAMLDHLAE